MANPICKLTVTVFDDDTLEDSFKFNGTAEDLANIFFTLAISEPEYEGALIAACHSLMVQRGVSLEQFVSDAISKMN